MPVTVLIHIANEEPILGDIDDLPSPVDQLLLVRNPRRKDGKDLHYIQANVTSVIWPMSRLAFIEIMPGDEEEDIVSFVREG